MNAVRPGLLLLAAGALQGCNYVYEVEAEMAEGQLQFKAREEFLWGPDCVNEIEVRTKEGPPAQPAPGDDELYVASGTYWKKSFDANSCLNPLPVKYGAKLEGEPFIYADGKPVSVEPKRLLPNVVYEVNTIGEGGFGFGRFTLSEAGTVTNIEQ